jgi:hypothetical protein
MGPRGCKAGFCGLPGSVAGGLARPVGDRTRPVGLINIITYYFFTLNINTKFTLKTLDLDFSQPQLSYLLPVSSISSLQYFIYLIFFIIFNLYSSTSLHLLLSSFMFILFSLFFVLTCSYFYFVCDTGYT